MRIITNVIKSSKANLIKAIGQLGDKYHYVQLLALVNNSKGMITLEEAYDVTHNDLFLDGHPIWSIIRIDDDPRFVVLFADDTWPDVYEPNHPVKEVSQ